ncbi:MAG: sigma-54-dependent Fis family transcriptional regulator [Candidatus Competibacteraceae bacterium]|nr:sigma-54-dependent Fis family transcriptional regulator [Candidatus Competibacteraceae bacterium]
MLKKTVAHADLVLSVVQGTTPRPLLETSIERSWLRCAEHRGIDPARFHRTQVLESTSVRERQERLKAFLEIAKIETSHLYQRIAGSGFAIILTDSDGVIVNWTADGSLQKSFEQSGLWLGALWDEANEGTNGIGTALIERKALTVHGDEHFRSQHAKLTCSAAPIFDPEGQLLVVLDISSVTSQDSKQSQLHTLALAALSARTMEYHYFLHLFRKQWVLRFHRRPEFIGQGSEGLLAFDENGCILAINQTASDQLQQPRTQTIGQPISALFVSGLEHLLGHALNRSGTLWPIRDQTGQAFFALLHRTERQPASHPPRSTATAVKSLSPPLPSAALEGFAETDPLMAYNVRCAQRVMNKRVSILLTGETGTGKEIFTKAIHDASARAHNPFVAVNCAAIPENLIESELFGYKYGAFTGARQEGRRGKILQANGGTLFLDEIGDMPLLLQTRLLRVLEAKEVLPLGSDTPVPVDLYVISATHRNLLDAIASGAFREDLYYRLNGLELRIPALRERMDRELLIHTLLATESDGANVRLAEDAFAALDAYSWPGNIRQLRNVLRTAVALCEDNLIRVEDLPNEIANSTPHRLACDTASGLAQAERDALLRHLNHHGWNISSTAAQLGVSRNTLYRKLHKHKIQPRVYPTP